MRPKEFEVSLGGWLLMETARNLQERVFCRAIDRLTQGGIIFKHTPEEFQISPMAPTAEGFLVASGVNSWCRSCLSLLPIWEEKPAVYSQDPELTTWLQDLAYILGQEGTDVLTEKFYPGVPDLDPPVEDGHVELVIAGMQRELDREGYSRQRQPLVLSELNPERQRALVERRRFWYAEFGIKQEQWEKTTFSLWDVNSTMAFPPQLEKYL